MVQSKHEKRGRQSRPQCKVLFMPNKKRVLCISYDESLLVTRKMILEQAGFEVGNPGAWICGGHGGLRTRGGI